MAPGPHGTHMSGCFSLLKITLGFILSGLDYLHSERHVIHTSESVGLLRTAYSTYRISNPTIKSDNIVGLERLRIFDDVVKAEVDRKTVEDRMIYTCSRNNFDDPNQLGQLPQTSDT